MKGDRVIGPEILYRYKYLPFSEGSIKMISEGTLRFTCPLEFNDPFDCMPSYDPASIENITKTRPDLIKQAGNQLGLSPAKRLQRKGVFIQNIRGGVESGEFTRGLIEGLGVHSLSRVATNILMWSHYADHHKGFVVELEIRMDAPKELLYGIIPIPVEYKKERPVISWGAEFDIEKYFLTKSKDWEYEQEERIMTTNEGPGIHPYSREHFLYSVIAGCRMTESNFAELEKAVDRARRETGKPIGLFKAQSAKHQYKVFVPGHPSELLNKL